MRKIKEIIVHHTAGNQQTTIQSIRNGHLKRGFSDIGYHGLILKEKGKWKFKHGRQHRIAGAHCKGNNANTLGISVAGNYEIQPLDNEALLLLIDVLADWCFTYNLKPSTSIKPHQGSGTTKTACPGKNILSIFKTIITEVEKELQMSPKLEPDEDDH